MFHTIYYFVNIDCMLVFYDVLLLLQKGFFMLLHLLRPELDRLEAERRMHSK